MTRARPCRPPHRPVARRTRCALAALGLLALPGCGTVQVRYPDGHTENHSHDEFAHYVEQTFRYHNRVLNDLIVAGSMLEDDALENDATLLEAEETMARECQPLNDAVTATIEGREIGVFHKLQLPQAVPACESASRRLESLLPPL